MMEGTLSRDAVLALPRHLLERYVLNQREQRRRANMRRLFGYYPDDGPLRRELYPKHMEFFRNGLEYRERLFMAANRVGKTEGAGGYETTLHLTGRYPHWWEGYRFRQPIDAWMAGKNNETTRDILQAKMFGKLSTNERGRKSLFGNGLVPADDIGAMRWQKGGTDLLDSVVIKHHDDKGRFDGWSTLGVKSFERGRGSFEGTEKHWIWLDEEPPLDVYGECVIRTMTTDGRVIITFTPLEGMSEVVLSFLPGGDLPPDQRRVVEAVEDNTWGDLSDEEI